ncbi:MAG: hypothetical protein EXQ90_05540 [Rhodospirillales bacterium]|nr:hypothetical protein [Rhodospirillales bacterium]
MWQIAALLALASALFFAFVQISTRLMSTTEDAISAFVITCVLSGVVSAAALPFVWTTAGSILIVTSGLYLFRAEAGRRQPAVPDRAEA